MEVQMKLASVLYDRFTFKELARECGFSSRNTLTGQATFGEARCL